MIVMSFIFVVYTQQSYEIITNHDIKLTTSTKKATYCCGLKISRYTRSEYRTVLGDTEIERA